MNDPRPAFLFHVRDFWTSEAVESMTAAQIGVYVFLLSRQWETGSLPGDATAVLRLCSSIAGAAYADVEVVLVQFPIGPDGRRRNARMEFERSLADDRSAKASNKAKERWDRWRAQKQGSADAAAVLQHSYSSAAAMQGQQCHGNAGKGREGNRREENPSPTPPEGGEAAQARRRAKPEATGTPITRHWDAEWSRTRPTAFAWQRKDAIALANCAKLPGSSEAEVCARITRMLESEDPFCLQSASPGLLLSQWNRFGFEVRKQTHSERQIAEVQRQLIELAEGGAQ